MQTLQMVLANLIPSGKVTVEVPNLDMDRLRGAIQNKTARTLREIEGIVYGEEMTDAEKVEWINRL